MENNLNEQRLFERHSMAMLSTIYSSLVDQDITIPELADAIGMRVVDLVPLISLGGDMDLRTLSKIEATLGVEVLKVCKRDKTNEDDFDNTSEDTERSTSEAETS